MADTYVFNPLLGSGLDDVGSGGGGAVDSVNGKTGTVVLTSEDINLATITESNLPADIGVGVKTFIVDGWTIGSGVGISEVVSETEAVEVVTLTDGTQYKRVTQTGSAALISPVLTENSANLIAVNDNSTDVWKLSDGDNVTYASFTVDNNNSLTPDFRFLFDTPQTIGSIQYVCDGGANSPLDITVVAQKADNTNVPLGDNQIIVDTPPTAKTYTLTPTLLAADVSKLTFIVNTRNWEDTLCTINEVKVFSAGGTAWSDWQVVGGSAVDPTTKAVSQTNHGFTAHQWLYVDNGVYALAKADAAATSTVVGFVKSVTDQDNFVLGLPGWHDGFSGLTFDAGDYFLSAATAGAMTLTEPGAGNVSLPLFTPDSATSGYFKESRGIVVSTGGASSPIDLSGYTSADYELGVGEIGYINYTAETSVPLHCGIVADGVYDFVIEGIGQAASNENPITVSPNNTTHGTEVRYYGSRTNSAGGISGQTPATTGTFEIGRGLLYQLNALITNKTQYSKMIVGRATCGTTTYQEFNDFVSSWESTAPWTSLGIVTFPFAQTGTITITRRF